MNDTTNRNCCEPEVSGDCSTTNIWKKEGSVVNPATGYYLEIDIWVPHLKLGFEFQDPYHYVSSWESQTPIQDVINQDYELLRQRRETLVVVPCWWQGDTQSLISAICFQRPDLINSLSKNKNLNSFPFPLNPPDDFFKELESAAKLPRVGELMLASFVKKFSFKISNQHPWWMGEKHDGIRFCWNTYENRFLHIFVPPSFRKQISAPFMDGEIWFGRGLFQDTQKLITASDAAFVQWPFMRMVVFDNPDPNKQQLPFEKRYSKCFIIFDSSYSISSRVLCFTKRQLTKFVQPVIDDGGEGVILRKPGSVYEHGRSTNLLKFKATRGDNEALVVSVNDDKSVVLQQPDGVTFVAPAPLQPDQIGPIKKGDVMTYAFESFSRRSVPLKPQLVRVRRDLTWEIVVRNFKEAAAKKQQLNNTSQVVMPFAPKPHKYYSAANRRNAKLFFENIAKDRKMDPLFPSNWYSLTNRVIESYKGGSYVLSLYGSSLSNALINLFPEMKIDISQFKTVPQRYWFEVANRRKFMENLARDNGFDPLQPDGWYSLTKEKLLSQGGRSILDFHYSVKEAIIHLFPEVKIDPSKFPLRDRHFWATKQNRRNFFIDFAKDNDFDPLVASNWYPISHQDIISKKGGYAVIEYHSKSHHKALIDLFPELELDINKFYKRKKVMYI